MSGDILGCPWWVEGGPLLAIFCTQKLVSFHRPYRGSSISNEGTLDICSGLMECNVMCKAGATGSWGLTSLGNPGLGLPPVTLCSMATASGDTEPPSPVAQGVGMAKSAGAML
jgi:hypothetical protein